MDVVLGVSMAPETIRMVLVEGQGGDGVTVEEDSFDTTTSPALPACSVSEHVAAAILGTLEGAAEAGHQLLSTGVTWTDQAEAAALRDALAAHKVENVMLVSAFLAAAALTQTVGNAIGYEHIGMLFLEPDTATFAVVDSAEGSITDVRRQSLPRGQDGADPVLWLISMVAGAAALQSRPEGLFLVGSGVDIATIKPRLEAATPLPVSAPEGPETALARGAALASANAPLFASSTAALAYAQDPGTGEVDSFAYVDVVDDECGDSAADLAYSAAEDEEPVGGAGSDARPWRSPTLLVGSTLATIVVGGVVALAISLAIGIRPTVALRPEPGQNLIVPAQQAPSPPAAQTPAPEPQAVHQSAPVVAAAAPAPAVSPPVAAVAPPVHVPVAAPPVPIPAPAPVAVPAPAAVPLPVPVPVPAAPVRIPAPQPPVQLPAPAPPVQLPQPPVQLPQQPVQVRQPPVHAPSPPVGQPNPPARVPSPPVQSPQPPVHVPSPPVNLPSPQPPSHFPAPQPPINLGSSEPPAYVPAPQAPAFPVMPAPAAPRSPAMPAPAAPRIPAMPAPAIPAPAMPAPAMPAPAMPRFNMPAPAFRF